MALYSNTYYPEYGAVSLRKQRGHLWQELVDWLRALPSTDPQVVAFTLTMRRLRRRLSLSSALLRDPFSTLDAMRILDQYHGTEEELMQLYYDNLRQVLTAMNTMRSRPGAARHRAQINVA